jgi:hypothetical protein
MPILFIFIKSQRIGLCQFFLSASSGDDDEGIIMQFDVFEKK